MENSNGFLINDVWANMPIGRAAMLKVRADIESGVHSGSIAKHLALDDRTDQHLCAPMQMVLHACQQVDNTPPPHLLSTVTMESRLFFLG